MCKIDIMFKADAARVPFCPHYIYRTDRVMDVYDIIIDKTDNHDLASEVSGWTDLAGVGEVYETDDLIAEIIDD